jgi:hypothetical protein
MERFQFTKHIAISKDTCVKYDTMRAKPIAQQKDGWSAIPDESGSVSASLLRVLTMAEVDGNDGKLFFIEEHRQPNNYRAGERPNVSSVSPIGAANYFSEYEQLVPLEETGLFSKVYELKELK